MTSSREVVVLDSDTLSDLSRGRASTIARARRYLATHGRLTITAVTVFERLRGYRDAIRRGKPFEPQLRQFETLAASCIVLPLDARAADCAATIWSALRPKQRRALGDILIAAIASVNGLPVVPRNRRDFDPMAAIAGISLRLDDWSRDSSSAS